MPIVFGLLLLSVLFIACEKDDKKKSIKSSPVTYVSVNHETSDVEILGKTASDFSAVWISFYKDKAGNIKYKLQAKDNNLVVTELGSSSALIDEAVLISDKKADLNYAGQFDVATKTFS